MGIGVSIFLIAVGAILEFAVNASVGGVSLSAIGWILMGVGAVGLVWALIAVTTARSEERHVRHDVVHH